MYRLLNGTGFKTIQKTLVYLENNKFYMSQCIVLGCDKTVTNTSWKNWVIKSIETPIKRPLQLCNCLCIFKEIAI